MKLVHIKPKMTELPGGWEPKTTVRLEGDNRISKNEIFGESAFVLNNALSSKDCEALISFMNGAGIIAGVSVHGRKDIPDHGIGSQRTTAWCEDLALSLFDNIAAYLEKREMKDTTSTDWWQDGLHRNWEPVGISPLLRFMRYEKGGQHYSHYDAGFFYPDQTHRTLMSLVFYLTTNTKGGSTRFIRDNQEELPVWERVHDDWTREAKIDEVVYSVPPQKGSVLIFDHRICHDVEQYLGENPRVIIRADVIFRKC